MSDVIIRSGFTSKIVLRIGDTIGMANLNTYTIYYIDHTHNIVHLKHISTNETKVFPLDWLTSACANFTNGVHTYIGHIQKWIPIPVGYVYYGDMGYLPPIIGGYKMVDGVPIPQNQ